MQFKRWVLVALLLGSAVDFHANLVHPPAKQARD
jgi:hypothetical protein